jgi:hypothetical protein
MGTDTVVQRAVGMSAVSLTKPLQGTQLCGVATDAAGTWVCPVPVSGSGVAAASGSAADCRSTRPDDNSAELTSLRRNMAEIVSLQIARLDAERLRLGH